MQMVLLTLLYWLKPCTCKTYGVLGPGLTAAAGAAAAPVANVSYGIPA